MTKDAKSAMSLLVASSLAWAAQDQVQRLLLFDPDGPIERLAVAATMLIGVGTLMCLAGWAAWRASGSWHAAALGAVAVTAGIQAGRFVSDMISGATWLGADYWVFWGTAWPVVAVIIGTLIALLILPARWLQDRGRSAYHA